MRLIFILCLGLFLNVQIKSQPDPIIIEFVEAQPIWEITIADTNFYEASFQPDINKYTVVSPYKAFRFGNDLLISSFCINHKGEWYGYILEKLDIKTGTLKWQNYNTFYNNGIQDFYKNLYLRPDGNLEMIGIKHQGPYLDTLFAYWNNGGGYSNYVRKVFSYETGELLETLSSQDSITGIVPNFLTFYPIKFDSSYLALRQNLKEYGDSLVYGYHFFELDSNHNLRDPLPLTSILYETDGPIDYFTFGQPQFVQKLDDTTLVCLMFKDRRPTEQTEAQLIWISIKDIHNIRVIRRLNIEHLIPAKQASYLWFIFKVVNNIIYISQPYYNDSLKMSTTFLTRINHDGEIINYFPHVRVDNQVYEYLSLVYASEEYDYFTGFDSRTGRKGFDILKLDHNTGYFTFISSLTSAHNDEEFTRQMEVSDLYEDGLFIVGAYTKKVGPVQNSAVKYYAFNGKDLGMDLISSSKNIVPDETFKVFPNPSFGEVNFVFDDHFTGKITIVDLMGREIENLNIVESLTCTIELNGMPPGIYYGIINEKKSMISQFVKFILLQD